MPPVRRRFLVVFESTDRVAEMPRFRKWLKRMLRGYGFKAKTYRELPAKSTMPATVSR